MKDTCIHCLKADQRNNLIEKIYEAKNELLGRDFYCVDPLNAVQCCEYFLDEIVREYKRMEQRSSSWYVRFCRFILSGFGGD